jgi:hypothetical protein
MGYLLGFTEGDWTKNLSARVYDVKVHDPEKFKKAWDKNVKEAKKILGDRRIGLVNYEAGGTPGTTHGLVIYGENLNDVQVTLRKIQKTKAFQEYIFNKRKDRLLTDLHYQYCKKISITYCCSMGRDPTNVKEWVFFGNPTPGSMNN